MRRPFLALMLTLAGALGSCGPQDPSPPSRPAVPPTARHVEALQALGLVPGRTFRFSLTAHLEMGRFAGDEQIDHDWKWTVDFADRVRAVRSVGDVTVVELERLVGEIDGEAPEGEDDLGITPRNHAWVWVIADGTRIHEGIEPARYARTRLAQGVFEQDALDLGALKEADLVFALPFHAQALWHLDGEARTLALTERVITGTRRVLEAVPQVPVPAGTFSSCHRIETQWTLDDDVEWVCAGVGRVRRHVEGTHASFRSTVDTVLVRIDHVLTLR